MADSGQETEAKFYVLDLDKIAARLEDLQARLVQPRVLETNIRFDLPNGGLTSQGRVLRLRRDTQARLTYKGPGQNRQGVLDRQEIEFIVEDGDKAQQFLEALGYQKSMYYEKYRATYGLDNALVMLDELPYGSFVEIEGETVQQIQRLSEMLNLEWSAAIPASYTALFVRLSNTLHLPFRDLSFASFKGYTISSQDLGVRVADQ